MQRNSGPCYERYPDARAAYPARRELRLHYGSRAGADYVLKVSPPYADLGMEAMRAIRAGQLSR